jgi:hypothetical protein
MVTARESFLRRMQAGTKEWRARIALLEELSREWRDEEQASRDGAMLALRRRLSTLEKSVRDLESESAERWELTRARVQRAWDALAEIWDVASAELAGASASEGDGKGAE